MEEPLRLIVLGQLFLTSFEPQQIENAFRDLIVVGQVYVSSVEAKTAVESIAKNITGGISIVPAEHARWIGESTWGRSTWAAVIMRRSWQSEIYPFPNAKRDSEQYFPLQIIV